ncbi:MAG: F0F1 ATP synthase subunit epsilon [Coleofasciculaceae cyanobacterium]
MKLKILLPTEVFLEEEVSKLKAEAENGYFTLLPRHIDFVTALVPGIFSFQSSQGNEEFLALDEGILVKCGQEVLVSSRRAVRVTDLNSLNQTVKEQFQVLDDQERKVRSAAAKLEANIVRRFIELEK